jgi:hypothetical protein
MAINQTGLNNLLAALSPKNNMAVLREQRSNALQKLQQKIDAGKPDELKQDMQELSAVDRQLAQGIYDEVSQRLEKERVEREAAFAKKERERERALAKHERLLVDRSMSKILSAANKADYPGEVAISAFSDSSQEERSYVSAVDRDLQEAAQYGIAAAEVAVRRKGAEAKAQIEERIEKQQADHRKKNKRVNIMI